MATAYTANATARLGSPNSMNTKTLSFTATDVAGEYWLQPSGSADVSLSNQEVYITDILVSSSAGTTKNFQVFINGSSVIDSLPLANFTGSVVARPVNVSSPLKLPGGAILKIKQLA